jgi:hypothetical protein
VSETCVIMKPAQWFMVECGKPGTRLDPRDGSWLCAKHAHLADKPIPGFNGTPWDVLAEEPREPRTPKPRRIKLTPKAEAARARVGATGIGIDGEGI